MEFDPVSRRPTSPMREILPCPEQPLGMAREEVGHFRQSGIFTSAVLAFFAGRRIIGQAFGRLQPYVLLQFSWG